MKFFLRYYDSNSSCQSEYGHSKQGLNMEIRIFREGFRQAQGLEFSALEGGGRQKMV